MKHKKNRNSVDVTKHGHLNIHATTSPGAKLNSLVKEALSFIRERKNDVVLVYFMAGIPDITQRVVRAEQFNKYLGVYEHKYEEVLYTDTVTSSVNNFINKLLDASDSVSRAGGVPVFCTVAPMSLRTWNRKRLEWGVTSRLLHEDRYDLQQKNLEEAILLINSAIQEINKFNGVATPRLGQEVLKGSLHGKVTRHYGKLTDGCHVNDNVAFNWARTLQNVMQININKF